MDFSLLRRGVGLRWAQQGVRMARRKEGTTMGLMAEEEEEEE